MRFELHRLRSQELIREADEYRLARLAQLARKAESAPRAMAATPASWPMPRRLLAWFRG
ncbi:hypothetical protein [Streptomyces umbrinus]|uniref:hypothetical protein n=1 Tax=Streptomyces umbrinus TaxID=67370 RepID=UPI00167DDB11|nr:hypothetical protein [Streptomyces umbrinus]MCR3730489.1 hypothetical protein [Streptomyces umbrinus]GHH44348.1 hypothetical protein GCM10018775_31980 [Streptomyces umbrinus]